MILNIRVQKPNGTVRADTGVRILGWGCQWERENMSLQDLGQSPGSKQLLRDR